MGKKVIALVTLLVIMASAMALAAVGCQPSTTTPASTSAPPATSPATPPPAQTITLRFTAGSQGLNPAGVMGRALIAWKDEVEQASSGRLKINVLTGAAPDPELFDVVAKGAGDMAFNPIMFNSGRFPTLEAMTVPDIGTVCRHPSKAAWDLWHTWPEVEKEFSDVKIVGLWAATQSPPGISFTSNKPIRNLEDLQGLKFGIYGEWGTKLWAALGAAPVAVPPPAVYESLQRKIVDASGMDPEMLESMLIYEVAKYWHNLCFQFVPVFYVMNKNTWNSLPADIQKIMEEASARLPDRIDADFRVSALRAIETGKTKYGMEVIDYSPEELVRWQELQQPVQDEYMARLTEKGVNAQKLFDDLQSLYAKYAEW